MAKDNFVCPICGEPTSSYMGKYRKDLLCRKHALALKNEEIHVIATVQGRPETAVYDIDYDKHNTNKNLKSKENNAQSDENAECVVCGAKIQSKYHQCADCYLETKEYMGGLDKNSTISEFRQYYYNLKDYIFRLSDVEKIRTNSNKLIAIALTDKSSNDDNALLDRVYNDVKELIDKKSKFNLRQNPKVEEGRVEESKDIQLHFKYSNDGHALDSDMEVKIDDLLYSHEIFHACHQPIIEITEKPLTCDWFIPVDGINKGIYIEYNGMDTPKKKREYEEKIELYKKHNLPFVIIGRDEPKNDSRTFIAQLIRQIRTVSVAHFNGMPRWKKEDS